MGAKVFRLDDNKCSETAIRAAATVLRDGGLVVFPTETVYGIGCNALDPLAVRRLYSAKQRPLDKPLLLHLHDKKQAESIAYLDERACRLLNAFTPGPLSVIVKKRNVVPDEVTSGSDTVGLRFPSNDVFLKLSEFAEVPIAATSANVSGFVSAKDGTEAQKLADVVDLILDGGVCTYSVESTIVSLVGETPKILRIGAIDRKTVEEVIGICD